MSYPGHGPFEACAHCGFQQLWPPVAAHTACDVGPLRRPTVPRPSRLWQIGAAGIAVGHRGFALRARWAGVSGSLV